MTDTDALCARQMREAIIEANNSLYGSQGFFLSVNGGEPDKYHLARPIEEMKEETRKQYLEIRTLTAKLAQAEVDRDAQAKLKWEAYDANKALRETLEQAATLIESNADFLRRTLKDTSHD